MRSAESVKTVPDIQLLDEKIRQLCASLVVASDAEVSALAVEPRAALHEHAEDVRRMSLNALSQSRADE